MGRAEGASYRHLLVVAEADALDFVGTKRLEEEARDEPFYTWRNLLSGYFR